MSQSNSSSNSAAANGAEKPIAAPAVQPVKQDANTSSKVANETKPTVSDAEVKQPITSPPAR